MLWWTPIYILLLITSALMAGGLIHYAWHNRQMIGARSFIGLLVCSLLSNMVALTRIFSPTDDFAIFFSYLHLAVVTILPVFTLLIAIDFYQASARLRNYIWVLFIIPVISLIFVLLPFTRPLIYHSIQFQQSGNLYLFHILDENFWYWIALSYSYGMLALSVLILLRSIVRQTIAKYRWQYILSLIGIVIPFAATVIDILISQQDARVFVTPLFTNLSFPFLFVAIFRFRLLDLAPIAREQVFDEIRDAVFVFDNQNRLLDMNPAACELTRRSLSDSIGLSMFELFPNQISYIKQWATVQTLDTEFVLPSSKGNTRYFNIRISPLRQNNQVVGRVGIVNDITRRKEMEKQSLHVRLEQERMKVLTAFISNVSHEFRTPLSVIQTNAYLMTRNDDNEKRKERLHLINNQIDRVNKLSEEMLLMTRLDSITTLSVKSVDIHSLLRIVVDKYRDKWQAKSIKVAYDFDKHLPKIRADEDLLFLAFDALMNNSIRYTSEDGSILLRTTQSNGQLMVSIIDNGIGIDRSHIPLIFNSFYRIDHAHTTVGFGLGLAIVKRVIDLHGGEVQVNSSVNQGATFTIQLPVSSENSA